MAISGKKTQLQEGHQTKIQSRRKKHSGCRKVKEDYYERNLLRRVGKQTKCIAYELNDEGNVNITVTGCCNSSININLIEPEKNNTFQNFILRALDFLWNNIIQYLCCK